MNRFTWMLAILLVPMIALILGISTPVVWADDDDWDQCGNNDEFTTEFRLGDCKFKDKGVNPFFILKPGYRLVLESDEEKSVETVLHDKKTIHIGGRKIKTRVFEERAYEDGVLIEISRNWLAICKKTNAVYYFGEWSRDCPDGFDENDVCTGEESNDGSWEAGVDGNVALIKIGAGESAITAMGEEQIVAFVFDVKGLIADISLKGAKFNKLDKSK